VSLCVILIVFESSHSIFVGCSDEYLAISFGSGFLVCVSQTSVHVSSSVLYTRYDDDSDQLAYVMFSFSSNSGVFVEKSIILSMNVVLPFSIFRFFTQS